MGYIPNVSQVLRWECMTNNGRHLPRPFSDQLELWLKADGPKTVARLEAVFAERSIVVLIILLMVLPALPLPTGGISHVFEIIAMLLALELILGIKAIWLPKRWRSADLSRRITGRTVPLIIKTIRKYERLSTSSGRRLYSALFALPFAGRLAGLVLFALALAAFLAPPFSGVDTLPALGAVMIGLALILEDGWLLLLGLLVGAIGIGLVIVVGSVTFTFIRHLF
jgi:hypothetical protein